MSKTIYPVRVDIDGMAVVGRSVASMRGIRFAEGDDDTAATVTDPPADTDTPAEDSTGVVDDQVADLLAAAQSRIAELESIVADREATILKVQAHNYVLLQGTPAGTTDSTADNSQSAIDPDEVIDPMAVFFDNGDDE